MKAPRIVGTFSYESGAERSDPKPFGPGRHLVVAFDQTPTYVSLLQVGGKLKIARLPVGELRYADPVETKPTRTARVIDERRRSRKRLKLSVSDKKIRAIVDALRAT